MSNWFTGSVAAPEPALLGRFLLSRRSGRLAAWVLDRLHPAHGTATRAVVALAKRSPALARLHTTPADRSLTALAEEVAGVIETRADWVLTVPGEGDHRERFTFFALGEGRFGRPRLERVVKLRRVAPEADELAEAGSRPLAAEADARPLAAEADALEELARALPEPLRRSVPAVLGRRIVPGWEVLELSALPGRSAYVEQAGAFVRGASAARHLHAAGAWLAGFQRATLRRGAPWRPPSWEEIAPASAEPRPEWHRRLVAELEEHPLPTAAGHGDFWARNLLISSGPEEAAGVVDWEHYRPEAPPFEDLFHFAWTYVRGAAGWHRPEAQAFEHGFLGDGELPRAIRRYLFEHARETGGDVGALGDLFRVWLLCRGRIDPYRVLEEAGRSVFSG